MPEHTPELKKLRSQIAANIRWSAVEDRTAATQAARRAFLDTFENQVDPDGVLAPAERAKRAKNARAAHFQRMALKSAQARRRRAGGAA